MQQVRSLQRQLSALRVQLNSAEASQKDFVELSQSLQVEQSLLALLLSVISPPSLPPRFD